MSRVHFSPQRSTEGTGASSTAAGRRRRGPISGHASSHWREAFKRALYRAGYPSEDYEKSWDTAEPIFSGMREEGFYGDREQGLHRLCGVLWNCTDTMPSGLCEDLDIPLGSTYAQAARMLRRNSGILDRRCDSS